MKSPTQKEGYPLYELEELSSGDQSQVLLYAKTSFRENPNAKNKKIIKTKIFFITLIILIFPHKSNWELAGKEVSENKLSREGKF